MSYPWYARVDDAQLEQGDSLLACLAPVIPLRAILDPPAPNLPVLPGAPVSADAVPPAAEAAPQPPPAAENFLEYERVVVLSQSCDLLDQQIRRVMVAPVFTIEEVLLPYSKGKRDAHKDALLKGRKTAYHLLNRCTVEGLEGPHLVVDFGDAFSVPVSYAQELASAVPRLRLLPPYREHLAQQFGRFYMRIGLPLNVEPIP